MPRINLFFAVAFCLAFPALGFAEDTTRSKGSSKSSIDFAKDIFPIFENRCFDCHGPDSQEGLLRMDAKQIVFKGSLSGKLIEQGNAKESLLYQRLLESEDHERMPLDDDPLSNEQLSLIKAWINQGAHWPNNIGSKVIKLEKHWAYEPPTKPKLPAISDKKWPRNFIDYYVLAKLDKQSLTHSPEEQKLKLLRRVYLDLIGLPPTVEQADQFLADKSENAYENVVDQLLKSKHFGERWARPWLDLARYADSNGYQADQFRELWPYRDWVIQAMNDDMPFDEFTKRQIAGDLLPNATISDKIATGFHRCTTCNVEAGVDPEENRVNQIIDRVNTTGMVWLGTTLECAQCHNHKYDPFTQKDYYSLFAFFNNTPMEVSLTGGVTYDFTGPKLELPLAQQQQVQRNALQEKVNAAQDQINKAIAKLAKEQSVWETSLKEIQASQPKFTSVDIVSFSTSENSAFEILEDQSILLNKDKPNKDNYRIIAKVNIKDISGFKLEALTHDSLPGKGPGRGDPDRPNIVLNEFRVFLLDNPNQPSKSATPIQLKNATADFSQTGYDIANAIDGNSKSAWAINPQFHKPHFATFATTSKVNASEKYLCFELDHQFGGTRAIGRVKLSTIQGNLSRDSIPEEVATALELANKKRTPKQKKAIAAYHQKQSPEIQKYQKQITGLKQQLKNVSPPTTLVMVEMDKMRDTHIMKRGNFLNTGEQVAPTIPNILSNDSGEVPQNRLGLASWLTSKENPLTSRVLVNRWWAEIFGTGIVPTVEDLGTQGDTPSHPQLLDHLAVELIENDWSRKKLLKTIVMSSTYRQSSKVSSSLAAEDPYNKLLARGPRFRLSAEAIRDSAMVASGLFSDKQFGPPIYPPQPGGIWRHVGRNAPKYIPATDENRYRRGVYVVWRRSAPYASFVNFDAPDRASCVPQRSKTNTPLQALTLMNDEAYVEAAKNLAEQVLLEKADADLAAQLTYAFRRVVTRVPTQEEIKLLTSIYEREHKRLADDEKAVNLLLGKWKLNEHTNRSDWATWFLVSNILLNLDETITKG